MQQVEPPARKRAREAWSGVIDVIAATPPSPNPKEALAAWTLDAAERALPLDDAVLTDYVRAVADESAAAERQPGALRFKPQLSLLESMHAKPVKPRSTDAFLKKDPAAEAPLPTSSGPNFKALCGLPVGRSSNGHHPRIISTHQKGHADNINDGDGGGDQPRSRFFVSRAPLLGASVIEPAKVVDFNPIIIVPRSKESIFQMCNVRDWLLTGHFEPAETSVLDPNSPYHRLQPDELARQFVSPGKIYPDRQSMRVKFTTFQLVNDPRHVEDWGRVCGCIVTGRRWEFAEWFNGDPTLTAPGVLFSRVRGFFPYWEEDKLPEELRQWNVVPLPLSQRRTKSFVAVRQAALFWEELFKFLTATPGFREYTLARLEDEL